jgi:hypothetical protein
MFFNYLETRTAPVLADSRRNFQKTRPKLPKTERRKGKQRLEAHDKMRP